MRVLVTGATGFAGRHLAALCAQRNATVVGVGRRPAAEGDASTALEAYLAVDLTDADAAREAVRSAAPERAFHLAAEASVARSWETPASTVHANLSSTLNVLEALRTEAPAARVLVAGSAEEYGPVPPERLPITESEELRPRSPYAAGKAAAGAVAGFYADAYGMHVVRTRAFHHTGPGQSERYVVPSLARQIAAAEAAGRSEAEVLAGNLDLRRDFTDVRDVVEAYWLALERAPAGRVLNVCSGRSTQLSELLWGLTELSPLRVNQRTDRALVREEEPEEILGARERITELTGWQPRIPLERTLADTLDWWRAKLSEGIPA